MTSPKTRPRVTTPALLAVVLAPLLLTLVQVVSGHPFSPLWSAFSWAGTAILLLCGLVIPWVAARPLRRLRATVAIAGDGVAHIVAFRSSESRLSRLAVLVVDTCGFTTYEIDKEPAAIDWLMIDTASQVAFGNFGQLSVVVFGLDGERLLDFLPLGKSGIDRLTPLRFHEYVSRISGLRPRR